MTKSQDKYFYLIWMKGIAKLSDLETNSKEYISVYDRILKSIKSTLYLTQNPNNEEFSEKHKSAEFRMDVIERAVRYDNYPKIGAMI